MAQLYAFIIIQDSIMIRPRNLDIDLKVIMFFIYELQIPKDHHNHNSFLFMYFSVHKVILPTSCLLIFTTTHSLIIVPILLLKKLRLRVLMTIQGQTNRKLQNQDVTLPGMLFLNVTCDSQHCKYVKAAVIEAGQSLS